MKEGNWIPLKMLCGHIAMWAVRQSPYSCPDDLEKVISTFHDNVHNSFDVNEMGFFTGKELEDFIRYHLGLLPEFVKWNERKNGNQAPIQFVSQYDSKCDPDDDFIDLDALIRNVRVSIQKECNET